MSEQCPVKPAPAPLPVRYTDAVKALAECLTIDDAVYFKDAAEALAAWSKIYKENEAGRNARQLRLHAHRRMGQLARTAAPRKGRKGGGRSPGPIAKLREHGVSRHQADAANHLAKMTQDDFDSLIGQDVPPAPTSVVRRFRQPTALTALRILRQRTNTPLSCSTFIQHNDPAFIAGQIAKSEADAARNQADHLIRWLQLFCKALAKS